MRIQNLESSLFLPLVSLLVGEELLLQWVLVEGLIGHGRILEHDGYAIVPPSVFGGVIARLIHPDFEHAPHLDFFLEQRIMIFLEKLQELVGVSPFGFVIVINYEGLT